MYLVAAVRTSDRVTQVTGFIMTRTVYKSGRVFAGGLPKGADLLEAITVVANEEGIKTAVVHVFGEVSSLAISQFDQDAMLPQTTERNEGHTIASLSGTISTFKRRSLARLSGVFAARGGALFGGTVALGTTVYACEVVIEEIDGASFSRDFDMQTGLPLWKGARLVDA